MPITDKLQGIITAVVTPFDNEGTLALEHVAALAAFQKRHGVNGLVVCGTNGEGVSLSVAERKRVLEAFLEMRGDFAILAGTGAASVTDAVELTRHAEAVGADAILALPPFFVKNPATEGLAAYFRAILEATHLPVLLYSIPQFTAVAITDDLLDALSGYPNLFGIKDSGTDWDRTAALMTRYPHLRMFAGDERSASRCFAGGGFVISGATNAFPELLTAVRDAYRSGDSAALKAAQARATAMVEIVKRYPFVGTAKAILARRGVPRLGVRPPLIPLSSAQEAALFAELEAGGFALD